MSREHVWANWMREYLPEVRQSQKLEKHYPERHRFAREVRHLKTSGDARSRKLMIVCAPCNNGWMSRLQVLAMPVLQPLLLSNKKTLSLRKQKILAAWATMFTMVYETVNPEYAATTADQRQAFMNTQVPPKNWIVWCAPFLDRSVPAIHIGFSTLRNHAWPVVGGSSTDACKAQITIFGTGHICFCVFGAASDETFETFAQFVTMIIGRARFTQIWPHGKSAVRITDHRTSPLAYSDLKAIRDVIAGSILKASRAPD